MADHWAALGRAEAWAAAAALLEREHPRAARVAWRRAADNYDIYCTEYDAHLPASRWDYDYGREAGDARTRATDRTPIDRDDAPLPAWISDAIAGHAADAPAEPADDLERAVARALAIR